MNRETDSLKPKRRRMWWIPLILIVAGGGLMIIRSWSAKRPDNLGVTAGKLLSCPESPNCVCTYDEGKEHGFEPILLSVPVDIALAKMKSTLQAVPRTKIITETDNYLHAETSSALFRFVDDIEVFIDEEQQLIHLRSASRVGHSDLGVNRERLNRLKAAYLADD